MVDSGVDYNHGDISSNIWVNNLEIPNNGKDDDGNGYIDDVKGWNFDSRNNNPMDGYGHGTHVAGTIAAVGNNSKGIIGVAPKAKVMALKGLGDDGSGSIENLANCLKYAADNNADIISNSWGVPGDIDLITDAVNYAIAKGCVVIASAGNENYDAVSSCPANIENVVAVAATDQNDKRCYFSNYGRKVDISAPGGNGERDPYNILSLLSTNHIPDFNSLIVGSSYLRIGGTSMACPHVSGLAALVMSHFPAYNMNQVIRQTVCTADNIDGLNPVYTGKQGLGVGRMNAYRALTETPGPYVKSRKFIIDDSRKGNGNMYAEPGEEADVYIDVKNLGSDVINVTAAISTSNTDVTINNSKIVLGNLKCGDKITSLTPFTFTTKNNMLPQNPSFTLILSGEKDGIKYERIEEFSISIVRIQAGWPKNIDNNQTSLSPVVADIDNDGYEEVIIASTRDAVSNNPNYGYNGVTSHLYAWRYNGTPLWSAPIELAGFQPSTYSPDATEGSFSVAAADLDNAPDGKKEIVVATSKVYIISSGGIIKKTFNGPTNDGVFSTPILVDLDNDKKLEILCTWMSNNLGDSYIYAWRNDGTSYLTGQEGRFVPGRTTPAVGDLNGDGSLEVVVGYGIFNIDIYVWNKDGTSFLPGKAGLFAAHNGRDTFGSTISKDLVLADLNQDGKMEIISSGALDTQGAVFVWTYDGLYMPGWPKKTGFSSNTDTLFSPVVGDLDGDKSLEILVGCLSFNKGKIFAWKANGEELIDGDQKPSTKGVFALINGMLLVSPSLADINGDNNIDVVAMSGFWGSNEEIYCWDKKGILSDTWPRTLSDFTTYQNSFPALSDIDKDGRMEMVTSSFLGKIVVWDLEGGFNKNSIEWGMHQKTPRHTGCYSSPESPKALAELNLTGVWQQSSGFTVNVGNKVLFNGSKSYDPDGGSLTYLWNFGNGATTALMSPGYTYSSCGNYTVTLTVKDDEGDIDKFNLNMIVYPAGDANGDRIVNTLDTDLIGKTWGKLYGTAGYDPGADLNNDGKINILDASLVGLNMGKTCP